MPSETLHFENARFAQQLLDNDAKTLHTLENSLGIKATTRDGWIKLEGSDEAIAQAKQLFQILETSLKAGQPLRGRDISHALSIVRNEGVAALKDLYSERIQTSTKKANVVPKTAGQKRYVEAIRSHDVSLGIGPAGTGKTYLAM